MLMGDLATLTKEREGRSDDSPVDRVEETNGGVVIYLKRGAKDFSTKKWIDEWVEGKKEESEPKP